jgi:Spy/CpxP family protein refolding chaperone
VSPWKVILATMVIFGCGVVTGALLIKTELPPASIADPVPHLSNSTNQPPPFAQIQRLEFLRRMEKQLDLTPSQRDDIAKIMKDSQERSRLLWDKIGPQMREELRKVRGEIRQVLTIDQQKRMDELLKSRPRKIDGAGAATGRPLRPPPEAPSQSNAP